MPDQMRADCISATGHPAIKTPNIDRLCAEGTRFPNAVTTCPLCMPARASFANGLYSHNHHMWRNAGHMPAEDETFFQLLQKAGYYTGHAGKSHYYEHVSGLHLMDMEGYMRARGLDYVHETTGPWATVQSRSYMTDEWERRGLYRAFLDDYAERREKGPLFVRPSPLPVELFMDSYIGAQAEKFLLEYDYSQPFCLFVGFGGPHEPWDAPGEYAAMYSPADMPVPIAAPEPPEWLPSAARERMLRGRHDIPPDTAAKIQANYFGKISLIDHWVGRIISACEKRGIWDDLLVIFWSDHGEMLGDHARLHKNAFYESSILVPFMLRLPGKIAAGGVNTALVQQIDAFPTIVEAAGAEAGSRHLGRSLWPLLDGSAKSVRDAVLSEHANMGADDRNYMVRTERYKCAVDRHGRTFMLFDLNKDPFEQRNLAGHPEASVVENEMRELLFTLLTDAQPCMH